jgi:hypothetical protein
MLASVEVNWTAILIVGVVNMVLGWLWYSPALFGKMWMVEMGKKGDMKPQPAKLLAMFVLALLIGYVMTYFISWAGADTFALGLEVGIWAAIAFRILPSASGTFAADGSWKLWMVNNGYWLVSLALMGGILAAMPA